MQDKLKKLFDEIKIEESMQNYFESASIEKIILYDNDDSVNIFNKIINEIIN